VGLVHGAAHHQPAHRVPDQDDVGDLHRPPVDQLVKQVSQFAAVVVSTRTAGGRT
jgi:hypothetical protein